MYQFRQTKNCSGFFFLKIFGGCNSKSIVQSLVVNKVFECASIIIWGQSLSFYSKAWGLNETAFNVKYLQNLNDLAFI